MNQTKFHETFPVLCSLLAESKFDTDIERAAEMLDAEFRTALESGSFWHAPLMDIICGAVLPEWMDVHGSELERNLAIVEHHLGKDNARQAFRSKLLTPQQDKLQDACYEIAATARACTILDQGSVRLEEPLQNKSTVSSKPKNSDVYGRFEGRPVRIEVTVLHEDPPESVNCELTERLEKTDISSGFDITMLAPLKTEAEADAARELLRALHEHHLSTGGEDFNGRSTTLRWCNSYYESNEKPFERVIFYQRGDTFGRDLTRKVGHKCSIRRLTPEYIRYDFPNPPDVVDCFTPNDRKAPVSKKIRDMLDRKLAQCEAGAINIVAFGVPHPMNDRDLVDGIHGAHIPVLICEKDENGLRRSVGQRAFRAPKAPFNSPVGLSSDEERETHIEPFTLLSGVWQMRLGSWPLSRVHVNPNASIPVPENLRTALEGP